MDNNNKIKTYVPDKFLFPPFKFLSMVEYPAYCHDFSYHVHDNFQVLLVVSGIFYLSVQEEKIEIKQRDILIIPPQKKHAWSVGKDACRIFQIIHEPMLMETYGELSLLFGDINFNWQRLSLRNADILQMIKRLTAEFKIPQPADSIMIYLCLMEIFALALRVFCQDRKTSTIERQPALAVKRALDYIQTHYREKITLERLAKNSYLGVSRFSEIFKEHIGESPIGYINKFKMQKAKNLLTYSHMPIGQISELLGFESIHYFSRFFRKHSGVSPSRFAPAGKKS